MISVSFPTDIVAAQDSTRFEQCTYHFISNNRCPVVRGVLLGFDIDYELTELKLTDSLLTGTFKYINNDERFKDCYFIYSIIPKRGKYTLLGKTQESGHFSVALYKGKNIIGFSRNLLNKGSDQYLSCLIVQVNL